MAAVTLLRRVVGVVVPTLLALGLTAAPGQAASYVPASTGSQLVDGPEKSTLAHRARNPERRLYRRLAQRGRALADVSRRAARHEQDLLGLQAVLAQYGFNGDPDDVELILPIADYRVSAGYGLTGPLWVAAHGGQDFGASLGEPLVAVGDGVVTEVGDAGPYGLRTILTLQDGTEIWYCHQTYATVSPGDVVEIADEIGAVGSTGNSTGPHLHLEVRPSGGDPIDPADWFADSGLLF